MYFPNLCFVYRRKLSDISLYVLSVLAARVCTLSPEDLTYLPPNMLLKNHFRFQLENHH